METTIWIVWFACIMLAICLWLFVLVPLMGYTIGYWVSNTKGEIIHTPWLLNAGAALVFGWNVGLMVALVTWICDVYNIPANHPSEVKVLVN